MKFVVDNEFGKRVKHVTLLGVGNTERRLMDVMKGTWCYIHTFSQKPSYNFAYMGTLSTIKINVLIIFRLIKAILSPYWSFSEVSFSSQLYVMSNVWKGTFWLHTLHT